MFPRLFEAPETEGISSSLLDAVHAVANIIHEVFQRLWIVDIIDKVFAMFCATVMKREWRISDAKIRRRRSANEDGEKKETKMVVGYKSP